MHCAVTIEIHKPELEALIVERMKAGGFQNVEDVLLEALMASHPAAADPAGSRDHRTGADLIAAIQKSPYREVEIEPVRGRLAVRDVVF